MKHYKTLIRLKQREVDQFRKQIANLNEQKQFLESMITQLENELKNEVFLAGNLVEMGVFFGDYSESIKQKRLKVEEHIAVIDKQLEVIAEKMMIAFAEQKKFEIAFKRKMAEIAYKKERKQQEFLDEMAARKHGQGKNAL